MAADSDLFKGRHFDQQVIVLCVRWYLGYKLSSRDLVNMMDERGIVLAHTTILRWVQRYVPEFEKRWGRYARSVGGSWRCDETYIKVKGRWTYLYRAVDKQGRTVDSLLSERPPRCERGQTLFSQSHEEPPDTARHHPGRLRGFASGHHRTEIRGSDAAARSNTIQQVLE